jgi:hypothetical protein
VRVAEGRRQANRVEGVIKGMHSGQTPRA